MRKHPEIVALILLIGLTALTAAQQVFIIPVVQHMLATASVPVSLPGRNFIAVSRFLFWGFVAFVLVTLLALRRARPAADRAQQAQVLNVASIVVVLTLSGQFALFVDVAKSASRIMNNGARPTASAPALRQ